MGYHRNANSIIAKPIKSCASEHITKAWEKLHKICTKSGVAPAAYILDNEMSKELTIVIENNKATYQLVTLHSHHTNITERAIQAFKNHFKAGLAFCDPNLPLAERDRLISQGN